MEYVVFCESNLEFLESWYTFIKKKGNEIPLLHLQKQLQDIDWNADCNAGHFTLDLENVVSASTAHQMIHVDLGNKYFHSKFDGDMNQIDLGIKKKDSSRKKIKKAHFILGKYRIRNFLSMEDLEGCSEEEASDTSYSSYNSPSDNHSRGQKQTERSLTPREETKDIDPNELPQLLKNK